MQELLIPNVLIKKNLPCGCDRIFITKTCSSKHIEIKINPVKVDEIADINENKDHVEVNVTPEINVYPLKIVAISDISKVKDTVKVNATSLGTQYETNSENSSVFSLSEKSFQFEYKNSMQEIKIPFKNINTDVLLNENEMIHADSVTSDIDLSIDLHKSNDLTNLPQFTPCDIDEKSRNKMALQEYFSKQTENEVNHKNKNGVYALDEKGHKFRNKIARFKLSKNSLTGLKRKKVDKSNIMKSKKMKNSIILKNTPRYFGIRQVIKNKKIIKIELLHKQKQKKWLKKKSIPSIKTKLNTKSWVKNNFLISEICNMNENYIDVTITKPKPNGQISQPNNVVKKAMKKMSYNSSVVHDSEDIFPVKKIGEQGNTFQNGNTENCRNTSFSKNETGKLTRPILKNVNESLCQNDKIQPCENLRMNKNDGMKRKTHKNVRIQKGNKSSYSLENSIKKKFYLAKGTQNCKSLFSNIDGHMKEKPYRSMQNRKNRNVYRYERSTIIESKHQTDKIQNYEASKFHQNSNEAQAQALYKSDESQNHYNMSTMKSNYVKEILLYKTKKPSEIQNMKLKQKLRVWDIRSPMKNSVLPCVEKAYDPNLLQNDLTEHNKNSFTIEKNIQYSIDINSDLNICHDNVSESSEDVNFSKYVPVDGTKGYSESYEGKYSHKKHNFKDDTFITVNLPSRQECDLLGSKSQMMYVYISYNHVLISKENLFDYMRPLVVNEENLNLNLNNSMKTKRIYTNVHLDVTSEFNFYSKTGQLSNLETITVDTCETDVVNKLADSYENVPYVCGYCGNLYIYKNGLSQHIESHTEKLDLHDFKTHKIDLQIKNTSVEGYECDLCKKLFPSKKYIIAHLRNVHDRHPYKCCHCDIEYACKKELLVHVRNHTRELLLSSLFALNKSLKFFKD